MIFGTNHLWKGAEIDNNCSFDLVFVYNNNCKLRFMRFYANEVKEMKHYYINNNTTNPTIPVICAIMNL